MLDHKENVVGNWNGDWELNSASATYSDLKLPGQDSMFSLQQVAGAPGVYTIAPINGLMTAAWNGCALLERAGTQGPDLPWPLPAQPTSAQVANAGAYLRQEVEKSWRTRKRHTRLEGDVAVNGVKKGVALFKVTQGLADGTDFLIALMTEDLDGLASPDGSAVGKRR